MRIASYVAALGGLAVGSPCAAGAQVDDRFDRRETASEFAPPIDLWLDQISYDRGARMRPFFSTEPGAYVTVVRVTSDGELRVMYPRRPSEQKPYYPGQFTNDRLPIDGDPAASLYEPSGRGFVFAIASYRPFDFRYFTRGRMWSTARLATFGRYGEPFEVVRSFVDRILPETADYSLDYEVYEIYTRGSRSVYGNSYYDGSWVTAYHDACLSAFGLRRSYYCQSYGGRLYGPIVVGPPRRAAPRNPKVMKRRPLVPDPMAPVLLEPAPARGRHQASDAAERAAHDRFERGQRRTAPREAPIIYRSIPSEQQPRREPRIETHSQPRTEGRQPQRAEPRTPARVEVRNERPPERSAPREPARPARPQKDQN